jgi:recombination protein RecT
MAAQSSPSSQSNGGPPPGATIDDNAPIASMQILHGSLDAWQKQVSALAGTAFAFDRFKAVVISCFSRTPKLMACTRYSIRQSILAAAELGLEVGGVSGEAYLIPYKNRKCIIGDGGREIWVDVFEAQFMAGYKGYIRLAHESGLFRRFFALPIAAADDFDPPTRGPDGVTWSHRENCFVEPETMEIAAVRWVERKQQDYQAVVPRLKGAYAVAQMLDSRTDDIIRVIPAWKIEEIRKRSKAGFDGPWITDYAEMAAKTAVRNIWKQLPKNDRMRKLEEHDQELVIPDLQAKDVATVFDGKPAEEKPAAERATRRAQSVADRVNAKVDTAKARAAAPPPSEPKPAAKAEPERDPYGQPVPPAHDERPMRDDDAPDAPPRGR